MASNDFFCIGVLALQGAFNVHLRSLKALNVQAIEVRTCEDLNRCHGLIIPGGESTVINHLLEKTAMREPLKEFAEKRPVFGTCAGLILMAKEILNDPMQGLGILDVAVRRNAYGRQADSFTCTIQTELGCETKPITGIFIRAPQIIDILDPSVRVLAKYNSEVVLIQKGHHLGATFHPELTHDLSIHKHFLTLVTKS